MKNSIKKIVLDLGGKEVTLTLEQAKKLHELLNELCGEKKIEYVPVHYLYWDWRRPYWNLGETVWYTSSGSSVDYANSTVTLSV